MSPEIVQIVGAVGVEQSAGSTEVPQWPGTEVPPGSKSRAHAHWGPAGTCEALSSPPRETREMVNRVNQDQAHPSTLGKMMGAKVASERWYRRPRKRRASGRAVGSQRTFIVPAKPGNLPHRDPVEGREVSGTWNPGGQDDGHIEVRESESSEHLNETPADSDAGKRNSWPEGV